MSIKWEYDIIIIPMNMDDAKKELREIGKQGWEIINIVHIPNSGFVYKNIQSKYFAFLKRQI